MIRWATLSDVIEVARNMRPEDAAEIYGLMWEDCPLTVARDCMWNSELVWCFDHQDKPTAILGAQPTRPGVWNCFMFATPDFEKVAKSVTKHALRVMIPAVLEAGAHRLDCISAVSHTTAHRWLEWFGAKREATLTRYGRNGEDYCIITLDPGDVRWRRKQQREEGSPEAAAG